MFSSVKRQNKSFISIRLKLILAFSVMIIPIFLLGFISSRLAYNAIESRAILSTSSTIEQSAKLLNIVFNNVKDEYIKILASSQIQDYFSYKAQDEETTLLLEDNLYTKANNYLTSRVLSSSEISNIWILSENKRSIGTKMLPLQFNYSLVKESHWYKKGEDIKSSLTLYGFHPGLNEEKSQLSCALSLIGSIKQITEMNFINKTVGVMIIDIDLDYILEILSDINIGSGGEIHLVSTDGKDLVTGKSKREISIIDTNLANYITNGNSGSNDIVKYRDNKYLIVTREIGKTGIIIAGLQPKEEMLSAARRINRITFYLILFALGTALVLGFIISFGIGGRISHFTTTMRKVASGNLEVYIEDAGNDEISILSNSFNTMMRDLKRYVDESVENEKVKREMQVNLLISHINPHMIYNTLNSVIYLAKENKNKDIVKMVEAFISLLQNTIKIDDEGIFATVRQEIDSIKNYEKIQQYRYPDKFKVSWDIDDELLDFKIPKTILQPLVENALFHGICPLERRGEIRISIKKSDNGIIIDVMDDGIGIDPIRLINLFQDEQEEENPKRVNSIGLKNIKERLKYLYGGLEMMTIHSQPGKETIVKIFIPFKISFS